MKKVELMPVYRYFGFKTMCWIWSFMKWVSVLTVNSFLSFKFYESQQDKQTVLTKMALCTKKWKSFQRWFLWTALTNLYSKSSITSQWKHLHDGSYEASQMIFFKTECNQNKTFEKAPTRHHTRYLQGFIKILTGVSSTERQLFSTIFSF